MLRSSSQVVLTRLPRSTLYTVRYLSLDVRSNGASILTFKASKPLTLVYSSAFAPPEVSDPHLEIRRAKRLVKEAKEAEAEAKGLPNQRTTGNSASGSSMPNTPRSPKFSKRNRIQSRSSGPVRGTERSRQTVSELGAAEAIMAFSQRDASTYEEQPVAATSLEGGMILEEPELPSIITPTPIITNIKTLLNNIPNPVSPLPRLPPRELRDAPATWLKQVYGGDYSQWQLDSQSYLKGARGPRSTYAEIILNRNPTVSLKSQKMLIAAIKRVTKEA